MPRPQFTSVIIAITALFVSLITWQQATQQDSHAAEQPPTVDTKTINRLQTVEQRLTQLEQRTDALPGQSTAEPTARRTKISTVDANAHNQLAKQVTKLQQRVARLEAIAKQRAHDPWTARATKPRRDLSALSLLLQGHAKADPKSVAKWQTLALDTSKSERERLRALSSLRGMGKGARGGAVMDAMVHLAQTSTNAKTRADVWRQMSRANDRKLVEPLIRAALYDADAEVREEAAETLGDYRDDPRVRQTLKQIQTNDKSEAVREQAGESLNGRRK